MFEHKEHIPICFSLLRYMHDRDSKVCWQILFIVGIYTDNFWHEIIIELKIHTQSYAVSQTESLIFLLLNVEGNYKY